MPQDKRGPSDLPEVLAQKIVYAGQSLLALIGELKRNAIVSDFAARNKDVEVLKIQYEAHEAACERELLEVHSRIRAVKAVRLSSPPGCRRSLHNTHAVPICTL